MLEKDGAIGHAVSSHVFLEPTEENRDFFNLRDCKGEDRRRNEGRRKTNGDKSGRSVFPFKLLPGRQAPNTPRAEPRPDLNDHVAWRLGPKDGLEEVDVARILIIDLSMDFMTSSV